MTWIAFVRHGKTSWNIKRLLQGHIDIPLEPETIQELQAIEVHENFLQARWISSPLKRTCETAKILSGRKPEIEKKLIEMSWGKYEGLPLDSLKSQIKSDLLQPARGLDLKPPEGESPRMVKKRLASWLENLAPPQHRSDNMVAVTHKGVIRAVISLATGWDMESPYEVEVDWSLPQVFSFDANTGLQIFNLNHNWSNPVVYPL